MDNRTDNELYSERAQPGLGLFDDSIRYRAAWRLVPAMLKRLVVFAMAIVCALTVHATNLSQVQPLTLDGKPSQLRYRQARVANGGQTLKADVVVGTNVVGTALVRETDQGHMGVVYHSNGQRYLIRDTAAGTTVEEIPVPPAGRDDGIMPPTPPPASSLRTQFKRKSAKSQSAGDSIPTVDALVVYTAAAANACGGDSGVRAKIDLAIAEANQAYVDSNVSLMLNLVHVEPVAYTESGSLTTDLYRMAYAGDGYLDGVQQLRQQYGADIVILFTDTPDPSYAGIAYIGWNDQYGCAWPYAVVRAIYSVGRYVFPHEVGHIFGCQHDPQNAGPNSYTLPYAFGYRFTGQDGNLYHTIMSYDPGIRIGIFSSPDLTYQGVPAGIAGSADNARVLRERSSAVANLMLGSANVQVVVNGNGTVNYNGQPVNAPITVAGGNNIVLTAYNGQTSQWLGWSGGATGSQNPLTINIQQDLTIQANFSDGQVAVSPQITSQPVGTNGPIGTAVTLGVKGFGIPAPVFQWQHDGSSIPGATSPTLTLTGTSSADSGAYTVILSNSVGAVTSQTAWVTIGNSPLLTQLPQSQYVPLGTTVSFSVATSANPVTYQWYFNGQPIAGAQSDTLTITNAQFSDEGSYTVTVTSLTGAITTQPAILGIIAPPQITQQPARTVVLRGANVTLSVAATGRPPLSYQWRFNGKDLAGQTQANLVMNNIQPTQSGPYYVVVSNPYGYTTSTNAMVIVNDPLVILTQPTNTVAVKGTTPIFGVVVSGSAPITYQWKCDGVVLSNQVYSTCRLKNVQPTQAGSYTVDITNPAGTITSLGAQLTVMDPPVIITQPTDTNINQNASATLTVVADGKQPLIYQWLKDGVNLQDATNGTLTINAINQAICGIYTVAISNSDGSISSAPVYVGINLLPFFTSQPANVTATRGNRVSFTAGVQGAAPFSYAWYGNGQPLNAAANSTLTLTNVQPAQAGPYFVVVANALGSATSVVAQLTVKAPPMITQQPVSVIVNAGSAASFTVKADGTSPLVYQWLKNGSALAGTIADTLVLPNVQPADAADYSVQISNPDGSVTSAAAHLTVNQPPVWTLQPSDITSPHHTPLTLKSAAQGIGTITYQWFFNGAPIPGATSANYPIADPTKANQGAYYVQAANGQGSVTSRIAQVIITQPPVITAQSKSNRLKQGLNITFSATVDGSQPMVFQWRKDGVPISGATNQTLVLNGLGKSNQGTYVLTASNSEGTLDSAPIVLSIDLLPEITTQPADQTVAVGTPVSFQAQVDSSTPPSYQWYFNGAPIAGAISAMLTIPNPQVTDAGNYQVQVQNTVGTATSKVARLTILTPPVIVSGPAGQNVGLGKPAVFTVTATGKGPLKYQWYHSGVAIDRATDSSYAIASVTSSDAGTYAVAVSNQDGTTTSAPANLTIVSLPAITQQPADVVAQHGQTAQFSVTASGGATGFQWFKENSPLVTATASTLTLTNLTDDQEGDYYVTVSNGAGNVTSAIAHLTVQDPPLITQQPVDASIAPNQNAQFTAAASGRSPLGYQWRKNQTPIDGATSTTLTLTNVAVTDGALFDLVVTNRDGTNISSTARILFVSPPVITVQPAPQTVNRGQDAQFSVTATGSALRYQWQVNGQNIDGATNSTLVLSQVQPARAGVYGVTVANAAGTTTSGFVPLTVKDPPVITLQPQSQTLVAGQTLQLVITATGKAPLTFLWLCNGNPLNNANGPTLLLANVTPAQTGTYTVRVANDDGTAFSSGAVVTVNSAPAFSSQPQSQKVPLGGSFTLQATVSGTAPITYTWYGPDNNPVAVQAASSSTLLIANVQANREGNYYLLAQNALGQATSQSATITILQPPVITQQPQGGTGYSGGSFTLSAAATGRAPLQYQWLRMGTPILGATSPTLALPNLASSDFTGYQVQVANADGTNTSQVATIQAGTVISPGIVNAPQDTKVVIGGSVTLSVVASGTAPLTYQWLFNGTPIAGANMPQLVLGNVQSSQFGGYSVTVSNSAGSVTSPTATLSVKNLPVITAQPTSLTVKQQDTAVFSVTATGASGYQWLKNSSPLAATTSPTLTLANVQSSDAGAYSVTLSNSDGTVQSTAATLVVQVPPVVTVQPGSSTVNKGQSVTFSVTATGTGPLSYQWYKNGTALPAAITNNIRWASVQLTDDADYYVVVQNPAGQVTSATAHLTVKDPPVITTAPQSLAVIQGQTAAWSVTASGKTPFSYQWFKGGVALSGATASNYQISAVQNADAGTYTVTITNPDGSVPSAGATLTVRLLPFISSQPQGVTVKPGNSFSLTATAGGEAPLTYTWYQNGNVVRSGVNATTYSVSSAALTDTGTYYLIVSNALGNITSATAVVVVQSPPVITAQPQGVVATIGQTVSFTVAATGRPTLSYTWKKDGLVLVNQTGSTCTIPNVQTSDVGTYQVTITNPDGSLSSIPATLALGQPPRITQQPQSQRVASGTWVGITVQVANPTGVSYTWLFNGTPIPNALNGVQYPIIANTNSVGIYSVILSNAWGTTLSAQARISLTSPPQITQQPQNETVNQGTQASLQVATAGLNPMTFTWKKNGQTINGPSEPILVFNNVQPGDAGSYQVIIQNSDGTLTSAAATITVRPLPVITIQPQTQITVVTNTATLKVVAQSPDPMTYQWTFNGKPIPGATLDTFVLDQPRQDQTGDYVVWVSNFVGSVPSEPATVVVLPVQPTKIPKDQKEATFLNTVLTTHGQFGFLFAGLPNTAYRIEASTNLRDWEPVGQVNLDATNLGQFVDTHAPTNEVRIYRITAR